MAKQRAASFKNAEAKWRSDQAKLRAVEHAAVRSEFDNVRFAGDGLLGRSLDMMYACHYRGSKIRFEPPRPRDGRGKPVFGSGKSGK